MRYHLHHLHKPGHSFALKMEHLVCDKRFWAAVGIAVLVAGLLALAIWAGQGERATSVRFPFGPVYPYLR